MRVLEVEAGEKDVYLLVKSPQQPPKVYAVSSSAKKRSAQLEKVEVIPEILRRVPR